MSCTRASEIDLDAVLDDSHSTEALGFLAHCRTCSDCAEVFDRHQNARPLVGAKGAVGSEAVSTDRRLAMMWLAVALLVVAAGIGWWALGGWGFAPRGGDSASSALDTQATAPEAIPAPPEAPLPPLSEGFEQAAILEDGSVELIWNHKLSVAVTQLPEGRPVMLSIRLPVALEEAAALRTRIGSEAGMIFDDEIGVGAAALDLVRVELPREDLGVGTYMLEVQTTEKAPLPLRRYVLEIR